MLNLSNWLPHVRMAKPPTMIVIHADAGKTVAGSIAWLRKIRLSYHYIIDRDGTVTKLVPIGPPPRSAMHAGRSVGPDGPWCNRYSLGVCLANDQLGEPYTVAQLEAMERLCRDLVAVYPSIRWLSTHRLISWRRKSDPKGWTGLLALADRLGLTAWRQSTLHPWA